ncbi:hypothetical protein [Vibrio tasmaniensis]|uniref:hypothetical protein n=1 Tax=Vibrio tasmaniensis TaxID=212663 RepID=UPI00107FBCB2|nr:hypothetical protein [Vibrio tasmaniensis]
MGREGGLLSRLGDWWELLSELIFSMFGGCYGLLCIRLNLSGIVRFIVKVLNIFISVAVIFSGNSFAFFETGDEKVISYIKANKSDEMLSDVMNSKFIPPYQSDAAYKKAVNMCRNEVFSDSYKLGSAKVVVRNDFLGHTSNYGSMTKAFIENSGGINQLFNIFEYDVVMLETFRNDKSSRIAASALMDKEAESPQGKKVTRWLESLNSKDDKTEFEAFLGCIQLELVNTLLKDGNGLFKDELRTVRFQVHNQESGRTKTLLAN